MIEPTTTTAGTPLSSAMGEHATLAMMARSYAVSVSLQKSIPDSQLADLSAFRQEVNEGLANAKTTANGFVNQTMPNIAKQVVDLQKQYQEQRDVLHAALAQKNPTAKEFDQIFSTLLDASTGYKSRVLNTRDDLTRFAEDTRSEAGAFESADNKFLAKVSGDSGEIQQLKTRLSSLQGKMDDSNIAGIAGAAAAGVGLLMVTYGTFDYVASVGEFIWPLAVGGFVFFATGVTAFGTQLHRFEENEKKRDALRAKLHAVQADRAACITLAAAFSSLEANARQTSSSANALLGQWDTQIDQITEIRSMALKDSSSTSFKERIATMVSGDVEVAIKSCATIAAQLASVQAPPNVPNKSIAEIYKGLADGSINP